MSPGEQLRWWRDNAAVVRLVQAMGSPGCRHNAQPPALCTPAFHALVGPFKSRWHCRPCAHMWQSAQRTYLRPAGTNLCRVDERAAKLTVQHQAAENQLAAILKAANTLAQTLAQGKEEAQGLQALASGREGAPSASASSGRGRGSAKQTSAGWR